MCNFNKISRILKGCKENRPGTCDKDSQQYPKNYKLRN